MRPGDVIAGRFEVRALAGEGGMGVVYRALDRELGQEVAVKVLRGEADEGFQREAQLLSHLAHPAIVRCIAFGTTDDARAWLATEWLEGETLRMRLGRSPALALHESIEIARRVAEALAAAHAWGVVHRDVTPANVLLLEGGVKLLDFGIARVGPRTLRTETTSGLGTPGYLSPEQARGDDRIDARADVFSLGCVLFECLTGRKAFEGDHAVAVLARVLIEDAPRVRSIRRDVPKSVDELVARMLSRDPAGRPGDGAQAAAALAEVRSAFGHSTIPPPAIASKSQIGSSEARVTTVVVAAKLDPTLRDAIESELASLVRIDWLSASSLVASAAGEAGRATEPALRAARASLAIRRLSIDGRIAVATGRSRTRRTGNDGADWIGDALDRAVDLSRLEPATTRVPVDDATAGLLADRFELERRNGVLVLGRESVTQSRMLLGRETPCIGRDREIDVVMATWDEVASEPVARVILLTGPAGIGKSRVREEVVRRAREQSGALVWSARGDPTSAGEGFGLIGQLVRSAAGIAEDDDRSVRRSRLLACVRANLPEPDVGRVAEFLGDLVGAAIGEPSVQLRAAREDPVLLGDQVRRAWEDLVLSVLGAQPLVIAVDDLQWGDASSVRALDAVAARAKEMPLLLMAVSRPEVKDVFPKLWAAREPLELALGRLPPRAIERIARSALGEQLTDAMLKDLVERSGGNAFFVEELVRAIAAGQKGALPDSVLAVVQSRLDALEPEARRVLRAASFFGRGFTSEAITALVGPERGRGQVDPWLAWLVERELIVRRDGQAYAFRHALVRDTAYAMLTDEDRSLGHLLAARFLESQGERDAALLAEQYDRGGAPAEAARCWLVAATQALETTDLAAVIDRATRSLEHGTPDDAGLAQLLMAEAHRWRGEYDRAASASKLAMDALPRANTRWFQAAAEVATSATALGDPATLERVGDALAGESTKGTLEPPAVVALARVALQLMVAGDFTRADVLLDRATSAPPVEGALLAQARVEQALAHRAALHSWYGETAERTMRSLDAFTRAGDTRNACNQELTLAHALMELGQDGPARANLEHAIGVADQAGLRAAAANGRHLLGILLLRQGDAARAAELERIARDVFRGNLRLEAGAQCWLALACLASGDRAAAEDASTRAIQLLEPTPTALAIALAVGARVAFDRDLPAALVLAERARALLDSPRGVDTGEGTIRLVHAECLWASGRKDEARAAIDAAKARLLERAARIRKEEWRATFIEGVPEHARTFALAAEWSA